METYSFEAGSKKKEISTNTNPKQLEVPKQLAGKATCPKHFVAHFTIHDVKSSLQKKNNVDDLMCATKCFGQVAWKVKKVKKNKLKYRCLRFL